jgi:hypothetical protein
MLLQSTIEYRQTVKLLEEAQKNAESLMENYKILEACLNCIQGVEGLSPFRSTKKMLNGLSGDKPFLFLLEVEWHSQKLMILFRRVLKYFRVAKSN